MNPAAQVVIGALERDRIDYKLSGQPEGGETVGFSR
jgi:hypothetical protein